MVRKLRKIELKEKNNAQTLGGKVFCREGNSPNLLLRFLITIYKKKIYIYKLVVDLKGRPYSVRLILKCVFSY